jgi:adenylate kinase
MRLILIGPPGSGKGTQADLLSARLGLLHLSTGDIFREAIRLDTPSGREAEPYVKNGRLVPDALVNAVVADLFHSPERPEHFVLDGYPRTLAQAVAFDEVLRRERLALRAAVQLLLDDELVVRRLSGRWVCPSCKTPYGRPGVCDRCRHALVQREDDREETVRRRLGLYHQNTEALATHYRGQGLLREVCGEGGVEEVYARITQVLNG